jgi:hypothetical protein
MGSQGFGLQGRRDVGILLYFACGFQAGRDDRQSIPPPATAIGISGTKRVDKQAKLGDEIHENDNSAG